MRNIRKAVVRTFIALSILAALSYSPAPAGACPPFERYEEFFDNCQSRTQIGWIDRNCYCGTTSSGVTNGLYRVDHFIDCNTLDEYATIYYGRCNPGDAWTQLSGPDACPNWC
jgi:hypothetical protein